MNIGAVSSHAFPTIGYAISASQSGRTASLPVSEAIYIYSHFEHVSGVLAPEGVQGVNINKLKILDTLIEQLSKLKHPIQPLFGDDSLEEENRLNDLIEQYRNQLVAAQELAAPYNAEFPSVSLIFNLAA